MKKIAILLLAMLFLLSACSPAKAPDAPLADILEEIVSGAGITGEIPVDETNLTALYGIGGEDVAECACCITMNGVFPDEILLIRASSDEAAERIVKCLENRLAEVKNQSKNYDPGSYEIAQKCRVERTGLYVSFFVSAKHVQMRAIYQAHLK